MSTQLVLPVSTSPKNWQLDPKTREIGRRGIAEARAALRRAVRTDGQASGHSRAA